MGFLRAMADPQGQPYEDFICLTEPIHLIRMVFRLCVHQLAETVATRHRSLRVSEN